MHDCIYVQSKSDLLRVIDQLGQLVPYNAAILCTPEMDQDGRYVVTSTLNHSYPSGWVEHYFANQHFLRDPVIAIGTSLTEPFDWKSVYVQAHESADELEDFITLAQDHGLREGISFACSTSCKDGPKTLVSLETSKLVLGDDCVSLLRYTLPHVHEAWMKLRGAQREQSEQPVLTTRESEILKWAHEGKTVWEIGIILSISQRTVKFHLGNVYRKLDVANRSHAIAKAIRFGLV